MSNELSICFDGQCWLATDVDGDVLCLLSDGSSMLPKLPEGYTAFQLLLPVESLLVRVFSSPLQSIRFLDANILAHEVSERSSEASKEWWLSWQAAETDAGISGLLFGLHESLRKAIDEDEQWQGIEYVGADGWARLQAQLQQYHTRPAEDVIQADEPIAVFDADAEGFFFGVWAAHVCYGIRRINVSSASDLNDLAEQVRHTLQAMGWVDEEGHKAIGSLDCRFSDKLMLQAWQGESGAELNLPSRNDVTLNCSGKPGLNFRHGIWKSQTHQGWVRPWFRAMAMAAMILLIWIFATGYQIYHMNAELDAYQQRISDAFHQGLPDETVLIDATAQLRRAAGGSGASSDSAAVWLDQLSSIHRVFKKSPWNIYELSMQDSGMHMSGSVKNIEALNGLQEALKVETNRAVTLLDTVLTDDTVEFRMEW